MSYEFLSFLLKALDRDGKLPTDTKVVSAMILPGQQIVLGVTSEQWPDVPAIEASVLWSSQAAVQRLQHAMALVTHGEV